MNLHEYQVKKIFAYHGLPIPIGHICTTPNEAESVASKVGLGPWVVKCQIHAGGRGKAGGIKIINNKKEVYIFAKHWLGRRLITYQTNANGQLVNQILVESATDIMQELYLGATIDYSSCHIIFMASNKGGIEIEQTTEKMPHLIYKAVIDPLTGPMPYQGRELAYKLGLKGNLVHQFTNIFMILSDMFFKYDLTLIEINPLVINSQSDLICLDSKLNIDDNALFRQPELQKMRDQFQEDPLEAQAAKWELNYVSLDGNIGCIVNGAGLAMSTMDIVKFYGGNPANFLDIGGNTTKERVKEAFKIVLSDKKVNVVFINIFGGIVRCDLVADGIINATKEIDITIPIVARLEGNNAELGIKKLVNRSNIFTEKDLENAVKKVISIASKRNHVHFNQ